MKYVIALLIGFNALTSCSRTIPGKLAYKAVTGTWRLFESGNDRSGGFNYVITPVRSTPLQTIRLWTNGRFKAKGHDPFFMSSYGPIKAYKIEKTTRADTYSFRYWDKRSDKGKGSEIRQGLILRNDTLRLYPMCVEGCHFSFVKINS